MTRMHHRLLATGSLTAVLLIAACFIQQSEPAAPYAPAPAYGPAPGAMQEQAGLANSDDPAGLANPDDPAGLANSDEQAVLPNGEYACSFAVSSYRYPEFPCVVFTRRDGRQVLEKTAGSQRIHGVVTPEQGGFSFQGTFYCPMGSCTEEVQAQFQGSGGQYRGLLRKQSGAQEIVVQLRYLPHGFAASGVGYGGRYGGAGVGGARYGGARPARPAPAF